MRQAADRLQAVSLDARFRRKQQGGGAVDDAGRVAGRDAAVLAERGRKLRQPFERRIRAHVIVLGEDLDALPALDLDRDDLFCETSFLPRAIRELLAAD